MTTIGTHGLSCQTGDNFASLALYMQDEATRIDDLLYAQLTSLTGFLARPTIIVTNSANVLMAGPDFTRIPWDTVLFNNSTFMGLTNTGGSDPRTIITVGSRGGAAVTVPYLQGWYRYGIGTRMTATGAITAYSSRMTQVDVIDETNIFRPGLGSLIEETFDTSTGGEAHCGHNTFRAAGISGIRLDTTISNQNLASSVNLNTNSYLWVTYIGPDEQIEVA